MTKVLKGGFGHVNGVALRRLALVGGMMLALGLVAAVVPGTAVAHQRTRRGRGGGGGLPAAAPVPAGSPAAAAQELAGRVLAGGRPGMAALRTALKLAGFGIVNADSGLVQKPRRPGAGVSLEADELPAAAALATRTQPIPLDSLLKLVAAGLHKHDTNPAPGVAAVLADLRAAAASESATVSFFANFVNDLDPGAGLLSGAAPADVELGALQAYLLQDLWIGALEQGRHRHGRGRHHRAGGHRAVVASAASTGQCQYDESASQVTTTAGVAFSVASTKFLSWALGGAAQAAKNIANVANSMLALVRLLDESHSLKASIQLVGGDPLVRTKDHTTSSYGADEKLRAHVSFDLGALQSTENCAKLAAALLGLRIGANNNGNVSNAEVHWFVGDQAGSGGSGVLDNPVGLYSLGGSGGDAALTITDRDGYTETGIQGLPQRTPLPPDPVPYIRTAQVGFELNLHRNNLERDLPGLVGAGVTGNVIATVVNTLDHMPLFTYQAPIQVKDWSRYYRVDFDSTITVTAPGELGQWTLEYVAHPMIGPPAAPATAPVSGSTSGTYATATGTMGASEVTDTVTSATGDTFDVVNFDLGDPFTPPTIALNLHHPTEAYQLCAAGNCQNGTVPSWLGGFIALHGVGQTPPVLTLPLQLAPTDNGSGLAAQGTWNQSTDVLSESTTIKVFSVAPPSAGS